MSLPGCRVQVLLCLFAFTLSLHQIPDCWCSVAGSLGRVPSFKFQNQITIHKFTCCQHHVLSVAHCVRERGGERETNLDNSKLELVGTCSESDTVNTVVRPTTHWPHRDVARLCWKRRRSYSGHAVNGIAISCSRHFLLSRSVARSVWCVVFVSSINTIALVIVEDDLRRSSQTYSLSVEQHRFWQVPTDVLAMLRMGRLTALEKPDGSRHCVWRQCRADHHTVDNACSGSGHLHSSVAHGNPVVHRSGQSHDPVHQRDQCVRSQRRCWMVVRRPGQRIVFHSELSPDDCGVFMLSIRKREAGKAKEATAPFQYAPETRAGCECVAHVLKD